jgi:phosphoribosylanthranilate isomerase
MQPPAHPRFKICCIQDAHEAALAVRYGASALGLVAAMPSGPGVIPESRIAAIATTIPPGVASFLLTSERDPVAIVAQQRRCRCNTVQIVDRLDETGYDLLRAALPGIALVQVVHVTGEAAIAAAERAAAYVDAILLDSGNPDAPIKELGGTGRRHDWATSARIRAAIPIPLYLAGGLRAENVAEAVATVGPFGVDVCTGVRSGGSLDEAKLAAFTAALHG